MVKANSKSILKFELNKYDVIIIAKKRVKKYILTLY